MLKKKESFFSQPSDKNLTEEEKKLCLTKKIEKDLCFKEEIGDEKKFLNLDRKQWGWVGVATNGLSVIFQLYNLFKTNKAQSFDMGFIFLMTILNAVYCLMGLLTSNWGQFIATAFFVGYNLTVMFVHYHGKQK